MGAKLGIRGAEWPLIVLVALAVAVPTALAPVYALAAAVVAMMLGLVVFNAPALLILLIAAFPWDDMLSYPTETVSVVKLLGALLLLGYALRALARDEEVRLPPTLPALVAFTMLVLLSLMLSGDIAAGLSKTLRYLLFGAFAFLVVQLITTRREVAVLLRVLVLSATAAGLYGAAQLVTGEAERVSGPIADANDFAYLLASVLPFAVYLVLRDRRCADLVGALLGGVGAGADGDAVAERAGRGRRGRAVGGRHASHAPRWRGRRTRRGPWRARARAARCGDR